MPRNASVAAALSPRLIATTPSEFCAAAFLGSSFSARRVSRTPEGSRSTVFFESIHAREILKNRSESPVCEQVMAPIDGRSGLVATQRAEDN